MIAFSSLDFGVSYFNVALSKSPVENESSSGYLAKSFLHYVPFPAPGPPITNITYGFGTLYFLFSSKSLFHLNLMS